MFNANISSISAISWGLRIEAYDKIKNEANKNCFIYISNAETAQKNN